MTAIATVHCAHGCLAEAARAHAAAVRRFLSNREEGGLQPLDDLFALDTKTMTWRYPKLAPAGAGPSPRNAATLTAVGGTHLVLHGGWNPFVKSYNDTFVMDVSGYDQIRAHAPLDPEGDE